MSIGRVVAVLLLVAGMPASAQAKDDLPGRVGRIADFSGHLYLSPEDRASEWAEIGLNYPVTSGDNLWVSPDGRAEVDYGGAQLRIAGDTNLHVSRLDDSGIALFVAQGRMIIRVRVLGPGDAARIDAPNTQLQLMRVGLYRIEVTPDRQATIVTVRDGEAQVAIANGSMQTLAGQAVTVTGQEPVNGRRPQQHRARTASIRGARTATVTTSGALPPRTCRRRWSAMPISTPMAAGSRIPITAPSGSRIRLRPIGRRTATDTGRTWAGGASRGSTSHPGATHLSTTVGGRGSAGAGAGAPGITSRGRTGRRRWSRGTAVPGGVLSASRGSPVYGWLPLGWRDPYLPSWRHCSNRCWTQFNLPYGVNVRGTAAGPPWPLREQRRAGRDHGDRRGGIHRRASGRRQSGAGTDGACGHCAGPRIAAHP